MAADEPTMDDLDGVIAATDPDDYPTVLGVPLNRILTIARGPINVVAATLATWLLVHVHVLGLAHVQHDGLSAAIAQGVVWIVTAVLTDRGIAQWVKGHHIELAAAAADRARPVTLMNLPVPPPGHPDGDEYNPADFEDVTTVDGLPVSPDRDRTEVAA